MEPPKLLVFDWDGTLMDSAASIIGCMRASFRDLDLEAPAAEKIRATIGLGLDDAFHRFFPGSSIETRQQLIAAYRKHWFATYNDRVTLFESVPETLEALADQGYLLAVATGKGRRGLNSDLEVTGLGRYFLATRTADEALSKPNPQMLLDIMSELGASRKETLMIGDTTFDIDMARAAGTPAVGVLSGSHGESQLMTSGALDCLESIADLPAWLRH